MCEKGAIGCGVPNKTASAGPGCGPPTHAVTKLNQVATSVMQALGVEILDLNAVVHQHCDPQTPKGQVGYSNCTLCDDETKYMGIRCGYHYSSIGIQILAEAIESKLITALSVA